MKKSFLSMGSFVNRLTIVDDLLPKKNILKHGFIISSLYGTFPNVIFNGGRTLVHYHSNILEEREWFRNKNYLWYDPQGMESLVRMYNEKGIGIRYTYSNSLITRKHLNDTRANLTLEIAHNPQNAVITGNPVIESYVRKHYPKFKIIGSATSAKNLSIPFLRRRIDEVDLLVLPPEYNGRFGFMESIGTSKLEILINERCVPYCRNRPSHYEAISQTQLLWDPRFETDNYASCCPVYKGMRQGTPAGTLALSDGQITALRNLGVRHFKFVGRHLSRGGFIAEVDRVLVKDRFRPYEPDLG